MAYALTHDLAGKGEVGVIRWDDFVASELGGLALCSNGHRYPGVGALHDALDRIAEHDFVIIGLEGLNTDGVHISASLAHIADFSSIEGTRSERVRDSIEESRLLLERWLGNVQFVDATVDDGRGDFETE